MTLERQTTDVYPTRYHAFDNPGSWAIFQPTNGTYRSCRTDVPHSSVEQLGACSMYPGEAAVLSLPAKNERFPHLTDGAHVEITGKLPEHGGEFVAECTYTTPTRERKQSRARLRAKTLNGAIKKAEAWLRKIDAKEGVAA